MQFVQMPEKLSFQNNMLFHNSLEELHKYFSPAILPSEFGGTSGPFSNQKIHEAVLKQDKYFKEVLEMAESYKNRV